jgi:hypothetical protein
MPKAIRVELYSRPGCHLCDEAKAVIEPLMDKYGIVLQVTNVDSNDQLREAYGWDIPVIMIEGKEAFRHRVETGALERKLRELWSR